MQQLFAFLFIASSFFFSSCTYQLPDFSKVETEELAQKRRKDAVLKVKSFIKSKPTIYEEQFAFFMDARINSGKFRFFIVDLKTDSILEQAVVAHGVGSETAVDDSLQFSNTPGSLMTSLGMYSVGGKYQGNFGTAYKLNGLEKTNNKAFERFVVLHSYQCVPFEEQLTAICNSEGCVMLSNEFFPTLFNYLDGRKKKVLLNIYY